MYGQKFSICPLKCYPLVCKISHFIETLKWIYLKPETKHVKALTKCDSKAFHSWTSRKKSLELIDKYIRFLSVVCMDHSEMIHTGPLGGIV